jgi:DNA-binding NarL/FixJ family response regulator
VSDVAGGPELRVVIADQHATTRTGLRVALAGHGFVVVAEASTAPEAVQVVVRERPDLCLLDVDMPGGGVAAATRLAAEAPDTAVVMLAAAAEESSLFAALHAGAQGYLLKDMDAGRLPHALRGVLAGEAALPRTLVTRVLDEFRGRRRRRNALALRRLGVELTDREWEVLEMLRDDLATKVMADRLGISPVTVRRHVSGLLHKLDVPTRGAAAQLLDGPSVQD